MERNLRLLGVGMATRTFGAALYNPFLALFLQNVLGVGYLEIGVIIAGVGLVQLPFNFAGGLLTDRVGRRRLILLGLAGETAATAGLAYTFSLESLAGAIVAATLGGLITTVAGPASSAYVADFAAGPQRTRGFTWIRIGFNVGFSAGVTLGGILVAVIGFAGSVGVAAGVIAVATLAMFLALDPSPFDRRLAAASSESSTSRLPDATTIPPAGRPVRESLRLLANDWPALEALLAIAFASLVVGQWSVIFPLFVHNVLGISYSLLGIGLALNGLVVVFGQSATTERVLGMRHTTIAVLGVIFYVAAFLVLGVAGLYAFFPLAVFFGSVVVLTIGENLITIPQSTFPSNLAPAGEVGSYNGAFALVGSAGFLASVLIGGWVLSLTANPLLIWLLLCAPALGSVILFRDVARRIPRAVDTA
ncbi:MAG TPA: MFS transporter [Thermoplasmata archaeon]|nr:MFS transporter [Thermoplasmata archaeon]